MKRPGFTILETGLVVGILAIVSAFSIPMYSQWQVRNDLALAKNQIIQGLERAKLNAMAGKEDADWSFYIPEGSLFSGDDYAEAKNNTTVWQKSETYPMPDTIKSYGLTKVTYDRNGLPDTTGTITLEALNGDIDSIEVQLLVDEGAVQTTIGNALSICYQGELLQITDSAWPSYRDRGATIGQCPVASSSSAQSSASSAASSAASSVASSSVASSSSSAGGGNSSSAQSCASKFTLGNDNVITTTAEVDVTFSHLASQLTYGSGGPTIPVHVCYSKNNGSSFSALFGGNGNCNGNGNAYGNAVKVNGTDNKTVTNIASNSKMAIRVRGRYQQNGWLAFHETFDSKNNPTRVRFFKNGDTPIANPGYGNQTSLKNLLQAKGLLNAQGKVSIGACELIEAAEIGAEPNSSTADFQDSVMKITFN